MLTMTCIDMSLWYWNLTINVVATFVALLLVFWIMKPLISFYPEIALLKNDKLRLQFRNIGFLSLYDVRCKLSKCYKDENEDMVMEDMPLELNYISHVDGLFSEENRNTILCTTEQAYTIDPYLKDSIIRMEVQLTHSLSGLTYICEHEYLATDIHCGDFKHRLLYDDYGMQIITPKDKMLIYTKPLIFFCLAAIIIPWFVYFCGSKFINITCCVMTMLVLLLMVLFGFICIIYKNIL